MKAQKITIEQYITERLDDQLTYYAAAATRAKQKYQRIKVIEIILAASVPLFAALITQSNADVFKVVVGTIGVTISILSGTLLLYKYDENWVTYRSTAEALKSEKYLFLTRSGAYKGKQAASLFIERIESILGEERTKWQSYVLQITDLEAEAATAAENAETQAPAAETPSTNPGDAPTPQNPATPADGSDAVPPSTEG